MLELVLTVCLLAAPERCKDEAPRLAPPLDLRSCMAQGQVYAIRWLDEHPQWALRGWACRPVEAHQEPA